MTKIRLPDGRVVPVEANPANRRITYNGRHAIIAPTRTSEVRRRWFLSWDGDTGEFSSMLSALGYLNAHRWQGGRWTLTTKVC